MGINGAHLARQDKGALERGEFDLDAPEQDNAASNSCGTLMVNPKTIVAAPAAADPADVDSDCTTIPIESRVTRGAWTREIEELCRALETQKRVHYSSTDAEEK
jgi:hypothetical protein